MHERPFYHAFRIINSKSWFNECSIREAMDPLVVRLMERYRGVIAKLPYGGKISQLGSRR